MHITLEFVPAIHGSIILVQTFLCQTMDGQPVTIPVIHFFLSIYDCILNNKKP